MESFKSILIIEDDLILRENTKEILELANFKTICAENGKQGIEKALEYLPDLILCDILMPVMDGYKVLEYLSNNPKTKNIPFLFISAKTDLSEIRLGMNLGADDYLTKPFTENELLTAIHNRINKFNSIKRSNGKEYNGKESVIRTTEVKINTLEDFKNHVKLKGEKFRFEKKYTVYNEHDKANYIYLLARGMVKTVKIDFEGKELITGVYKEDNFFGLTSFKYNSVYDETAVTLNNVFGYKFSSKAYRDIVSNNPELVLEIAEILTTDLSHLKEHLLEMAYSSVLKKTTQTILKFANETPENPGKISNITRNEMAHIAGISTESFIRSLSQLRKRKIIEIDGRDIRILDFEKLERIQ